MNIVPISKKKIEARLADINKCLFELKRFQKNVIQKDSNDIEEYCRFIVCLLKDPKKYGLELE